MQAGQRKALLPGTYRMIYLDNAATTRPDPKVVEEMLPWLTEQYMNPSAFYQPAVKTRAFVERARQQIAAFLGVSPAGICFTSGGTESDNWAIRTAAELHSEKGKHIITSAVEHHSVRNTLRYLETKGFEVTRIPVDRNGEICTDALRKAVRPDTILITVMHANNELGTIEPVEEIGSIAAENGIIFHTDAVQTFGHIPIDIERCHIDMLSASAHKLYGPKGIGLLYIDPGSPFGSFMFGGRQEKGLRPGTENVSSIAGFARAAVLAGERMEEEAAREAALRDMMGRLLKQTIPGVRINGTADRRLPGILNVTFPGYDAEALLILLDQNGICASAGSACSAGALEPSHVLRACGFTAEEAKQTLRFSLGKETTSAEIEETVNVLERIISEGKGRY